jgi:hypothetical protein
MDSEIPSDGASYALVIVLVLAMLGLAFAS